MTTEAPPPKEGPNSGPGGPGAAVPGAATDFTEVQRSPQFGELRRSYRGFAFPLTLAFILWYLLYVLLSNFAGGFMATKVAGNINVALVLGLAQFLTTFLIAWWYARHAATRLDPKAEAIKNRLEDGA